MKKQFSNDQDYSYRWIKINYYLQMLSQECRMGQVNIAQNTIEDLMQEWVYQDILAKTSENKLIRQYHYPSGSLQKLDSLLSDSKFSEKQIVLEIKRINDNMDSLFSIIRQAEKM